jgi:hypothetical protein
MDCRPDMWVESVNTNPTTNQKNRVIEMYFLQEDGKFCLVSETNIVPANTSFNPLLSSSFTFFDLLRKGNNSAMMVDNVNRVHMFVNSYNIPNPSNAALPLCTKTEKLDSTGKHVVPFDGFPKIGASFTTVIFLFI